MREYDDFQIQTCSSAPRPILNVASSLDPASLGDRYGAINIDIQTYERTLQFDMAKRTSNFVHGDALNLPFDDCYAGTVVLGEFLEHCPFDTALKALKEAHRVLRSDGCLIITLPLDDRQFDEQGIPDSNYLLPHGITSWHTHCWTDAELDSLFRQAGFEIVLKERLFYPALMHKETQGYGLILKKEEST